MLQVRRPARRFRPPDLRRPHALPTFGEKRLLRVCVVAEAHGAEAADHRTGVLGERRLEGFERLLAELRRIITIREKLSRAVVPVPDRIVPLPPPHREAGEEPTLAVEIGIIHRIARRSHEPIVDLHPRGRTVFVDPHVVTVRVGIGLRHRRTAGEADHEPGPERKPRERQVQARDERLPELAAILFVAQHPVLRHFTGGDGSEHEVHLHDPRPVLRSPEKVRHPGGDEHRHHAAVGGHRLAEGVRRHDPRLAPGVSDEAGVVDAPQRHLLELGRGLRRGVGDLRRTDAQRPRAPQLRGDQRRTSRPLFGDHRAAREIHDHLSRGCRIGGRDGRSGRTSNGPYGAIVHRCRPRGRHGCRRRLLAENGGAGRVGGNTGACHFWLLGNGVFFVFSARVAVSHLNTKNGEKSIDTVQFLQRMLYEEAQDDTPRIVEKTADPEEVVIENTLRPSRLDDFVGQDDLKTNLSIFIDAAKARNEPIEHLLLYGNPGLGKTTLAHIIGAEMGANVRVTSGPALERVGDLAAILSNLSRGDVLFIDEIHRMNHNIEEVLYPAMEDFALDLVVGKGPSARTLRLNLEPFTIIGATTRLSLLSAPLRDRFGSTLHLNFYSDDDMAKILHRSAKILSLDMDEETAKTIACRARKTPRIANRLLKRVRDVAQIRHEGILTPDVAHEALTMLAIDDLGLDPVDRHLLLTLIDKFNGGPVGLGTLAAATQEETETIEEVYEPYLLQLGFLERTPRGRIATTRAYEHLGRTK